MSRISIPHDNDVVQLKALLTLAADGLAAEVLEGTEQERAAVILGRLFGRDPIRLVLTCRDDERQYDWPADWQRALADYARATAAGATVDARSQEPAGSGPPTHERRPLGRSADLRADITSGRGSDTATVSPNSRPEQAGARPVRNPDVALPGNLATSGGVR